MQPLLDLKAFGAVQQLAKELDHVHANQERRERATRTQCGLPQRKVVAAQHLVAIGLPERRVLKLPRILERIARLGCSRADTIAGESRMRVVLTHVLADNHLAGARVKGSTLGTAEALCQGATSTGRTRSNASRSIGRRSTGRTALRQTVEPTQSYLDEVVAWAETAQELVGDVLASHTRRSA